MKKNRLKKALYIALLASTLCIICPFAIYFGPIPFSMATFFIMLYATIFDIEIAVGSVILYIGLGCIGLPVFTGGIGGIQKIFSQTGGFIIGYIFLSFIISLLYNKMENTVYKLLVLFLANLCLYVVGISYFMFITNNNFITSISLCVVPFLLTDTIKIILVMIVSKLIRLRFKYYS